MIVLTGTAYGQLGLADPAGVPAIKPAAVALVGREKTLFRGPEGRSGKRQAVADVVERVKGQVQRVDAGIGQDELEGGGLDLGRRFQAVFLKERFRFLGRLLHLGQGPRHPLVEGLAVFLHLLGALFHIEIAAQGVGLHDRRRHVLRGRGLEDLLPCFFLQEVVDEKHKVEAAVVDRGQDNLLHGFPLTRPPTAMVGDPREPHESLFLELVHRLVERLVLEGRGRRASPRA